MELNNFVHLQCRLTEWGVVQMTDMHFIGVLPHGLVASSVISVRLCTDVNDRKHPVEPVIRKTNDLKLCRNVCLDFASCGWPLDLHCRALLVPKD